MRTITINATAAAVGALVLAGGTFAAGYITSNNAAPTKAASSQPVAQAAPQRATNVSSQRVARTGELVPQSLKASAASTLKVGSKVYSIWLNPAEFHPLGDPRECALANDGSYLYRNLGTCTTYIARLPLPEGAALDSYSWVGVDNDATSQITLGLAETGWSYYMMEEMKIFGGAPGNFLVGSGAASAEPQVRTFSGSLNNRSVDFYYGDSRSSVHQYETLVLTVPTSQDVGLFGVEVKWRKQYGPTPAIAKFIDINPQHPYFTEIEMLGKSGISNGCGNNKYCADAPVTRGEMAVFLSRAMGLYDEAQ